MLKQAGVGKLAYRQLQDYLSALRSLTASVSTAIQGTDFLSDPLQPYIPSGMQLPDPRSNTDVRVARFVQSSATLTQLPNPKHKEIAVVGRSNVGKSSLVNLLTGSSKLAHTSKTPGKILFQGCNHSTQATGLTTGHTAAYMLCLQMCFANVQGLGVSCVLTASACLLQGTPGQSTTT